MEENTVADRIRLVMEERKLTIEAFADLLGEKPQRVKDVLRGKQRVPEEMLTALANQGVDVAYLLTGRTGSERQNEFEARLDAIKETTRRSLELTRDLQKGELVRDILLADRWNKPELIEAATERYVTVRLAQPSIQSRAAETLGEYKPKPVKPTVKKPSRGK